MLAIGGAAGAASFTHVYNVAAAHGQPGWLAWADAIVLELMSIASGLELRRRKRAHASTKFPAVVLGCAVTLSLAAQVVEAEPSPIGWIAAAVPALGFLVMVKVALGYTNMASRTEATPSATRQPDRTADAEPSAEPAGERSARRTVHPSSSSHRADGPTRHRNRRRHERSADHSQNADELLPAARRIRDQLATDEQALTRAALAEALRTAGHAVSNTRVSDLLKTIKAESSPTSALQDNRPRPGTSLAPPLPPRQQSAVVSSPTHPAGTTNRPDGDSNPRHHGSQTSPQRSGAPQS
ncbi:DUF2637 domain-containing protein [Micromonospora sp. NPDC049559]|uniref:DUF2637 domain-containing protein n=1 Tax=Micromonospora sp. NPDC049559 TaxID=3155923 RepID=UPI00341B9C46